MAAVASAAPAQQLVIRNGPGESDAKSMMLVNADDELAGFLDRARKFIEDKQYDQAIGILHALILRDDSGFISVSGGRRYVSLWRKANDLLGKMPPAGLDRYRALYDPQARQLYRKAVATGEAALLRRLVRRYLHTSFGARGLDALAAIDFDRGRFFIAAGYWRQSLRISPDRPDAAAMLAKIAGAYHLAGEESKAARLAKRLADEYPAAQAVLGGRRRRVGEFLASVMSMAPVVVRARSGGQPSWSGILGFPDGQTLMDESDAVLMPRWRSPSPLGGASLKLPKDLIALKEGWIAASRGRGRGRGRGRQFAGKLRDGQLRVKYNFGGRRSEMAYPAVVHPVVVGDTVLCRTDRALVAYDALTGDRLWDSGESFPLYRSVARSVGGRMLGSYYGYGLKIGDRGWQTVTVGGGMAFALGNFRQSNMVVRRRSLLSPGDSQKLADTSTLAAFSTGRGDGKKSLWRVGYGVAGKSELLGGCKFVAAPTYRDGRLYALVTFRMSYYAVCLEAATGSLVWQSLISQLPNVNTRRYGGRLSYPLGRGSSPAVVDGRVFVVTNAGVAAALDAETGQGIWAYEYDSRVAAQAGRSYNPRRNAGGFYPPNPVIVWRGQVVCLPADGEKVLALSAGDGRLLWQSDRRGQHNLSAVDPERILLSGRGLIVLSVAGRGKPLFSAADKGIVGRPAVTPTRVLASGRGVMVRLDLDSYKIDTTRLGSADGILGNLMSVAGRLFAANAVGVCGYFDYDNARRLLTGRIATTAAADAPGVLFQRAQLAFNAGRFGQARDDLTDCSARATRLGDEQLPLLVRPWLYRTRIALANHAGSDERMLDEFTIAGRLADTVQEKAHMMLRMARYHERTKHYARAAETAQKISELYPDEKLVDVRIGPDVDDVVRFSAERPRVRGKVLAQAFIGRLIVGYGRQVYAKFDDMAMEALSRAIGSEDADAMVAVARRWPHCSSADYALMEAGEIYYRRGLAIHQRSGALAARADNEPAKASSLAAEADVLAAEADGLFGRSVGLLAEVAARRDSTLRIKANVGLTAIYARRGHLITAGLRSDEIRRLCGQGLGFDLNSQVAFGEYSGTVASVLQQLESVQVTSRGSSPLPPSINVPLKNIFALADGDGRILRDQNFRAVRIGPNVLVMRGRNVVMLNTSVADEPSAVQWVAPVGMDDSASRASTAPPGWSLVAGVSSDAATLVVANGKSIVGLDVRTGRNVWRTLVSKLGITRPRCMSTGDGVLVIGQSTGRLICLDIATGRELWRSAAVGREFLYAPPLIGSGIVVSTSRSGKGYVVRAFSAQSGKLLGRWRSGVYSFQSVITDEGLLVLMLDGVLSVREVSALSAPPIWRRKYTAKLNPAVLAVTSDSIAVSPSRSSDRIEILSLTGQGRLVATLQTVRAGNKPALPADAWFVAGRLVVAGSAIPTARRKTTYGRFSNIRGRFNLQAFDLAAAEGPDRLLQPTWTWNQDKSDNRYGLMTPAGLTRRYIVVFRKHYQTRGGLYARVIDVRSGEVVEKIDMIGKAGNLKNRTISQRRIGPPVVIGGRLCVETCEGITIYGAR